MIGIKQKKSKLALLAVWAASTWSSWTGTKSGSWPFFSDFERRSCSFVPWVTICESVRSYCSCGDLLCFLRTKLVLSDLVKDIVTRKSAKKNPKQFNCRSFSLGQTLKGANPYLAETNRDFSGFQGEKQSCFCLFAFFGKFSLPFLRIMKRGV